VGVEPDRFDDVAFRMLEGPEPPRRPPRRRRRWLLGAAAAFLMTGALAAGASALTGGDDDASVTAAPKPRTNISYTANGVPYARDGAGCRAGKHHARKREDLPADVKY
jgi:hypothetical protein